MNLPQLAMLLCKVSTSDTAVSTHFMRTRRSDRYKLRPIARHWQASNPGGRLPVLLELLFTQGSG